jgi:hypothetical protein
MQECFNLKQTVDRGGQRLLSHFETNGDGRGLPRGDFRDQGDLPAPQMTFVDEDFDVHRENAPDRTDNNSRTRSSNSRAIRAPSIKTG